MKRLIIIVLLAVCVAPLLRAEETKEERDARMKWWREAKFGMFIHWGVYAVPAGTHNGKQVAGIGEWIMCRGKIPIAEYKPYAKQFNPVKYNPDDWVRLAKEAGMKYMVITSKHHDGFALFDSKVSDWNVVKATPYGKDLLKPLAEACRKYGMKLGFYYSQNLDWCHPGGGSGAWDPAHAGDPDAYVNNIVIPQVREILSNYGDVAVLWWDIPGGVITKERADKIIPLLKLQPGIIYNNRLGGGYKGDTETPEQHIPATGYKDRDWETCMTMNDTWGFKSYDHNWKSTQKLLQNLVDIVSKGGNYLLNVGPTAEGLIPEPSIERLQQVGAWMKANGEAIYGTQASPFKKLPFNGRCTRKPGKLYLHVFTWPADGRLVVPTTSKITKAYLLADATKPLAVTCQTIALPAEAPDKIASVVVAEIEGEVQVVEPGATAIEQAADGVLTLPVGEAVLHGELKLEAKGTRENIGYWIKPADWVEWSINITKPGKFTVTAEIAAEKSGSFEIIIGDQKLKAQAPKTGDYGKFQKVKLGEIEIASVGKQTLAIKPVKQGWQPFNLTALTLTPVK